MAIILIGLRWVYKPTDITGHQLAIHKNNDKTTVPIYWMIKVPKSSLLGVILDHWGPYWELIHPRSIKHPHCMVPNISKPPKKLWLLAGEYWGECIIMPRILYRFAG